MAVAANQSPALTGAEAGAVAVAFPIKKIRRFRLAPRPGAVLRYLKALTGAQDTPDLDQALEAETRALALDTAAWYATVTRADSPEWTGPLWSPVEGEPAPVALTLFAATIGGSLEAALADALSRGETFRSQLLTALGEDLADGSARFVERLAAEEARLDSCELRDRKDVAPADGAALLNRLGVPADVVLVDATGRLTPRFTRLGAIPWGPPSKRRK